jgi:hypothetical protein
LINPETFNLPLNPSFGSVFTKKIEPAAQYPDPHPYLEVSLILCLACGIYKDVYFSDNSPFFQKWLGRGLLNTE